MKEHRHLCLHTGLLTADDQSLSKHYCLLTATLPGHLTLAGLSACSSSAHLGHRNDCGIGQIVQKLLYELSCLPHALQGIPCTLTLLSVGGCGDSKTALAEFILPTCVCVPELADGSWIGNENQIRS